MSSSHLFKIIIKGLISCVILAWFISRNDLRQVLNVLLSIPFLSFLWALLLYFLTLCISTLRWHQLIPECGRKQLLSLTFISQYYSLVLPGQMTGEAVKAYKLGKGRQNAEQIAASVIIDRILGLIGMIGVAITGLLFSATDAAKDVAVWFVPVMIGLLTVLYIFQYERFNVALRQLLLLLKRNIFKTRNLVDRCLRLMDEWKAYLNKPVILLKSLLLGIVYQLIGVCISYILGNTAGIHIPFTDWCWIFGAVSIIVFVPITIGGVGLREGGFIFLLSIFHIPSEKALALSLAIFGLHIIGALIGGIIDFRSDLSRFQT